MRRPTQTYRTAACANFEPAFLNAEDGVLELHPSRNTRSGPLPGERAYLEAQPRSPLLASPAPAVEQPRGRSPGFR